MLPISMADQRSNLFEWIIWHNNTLLGLKAVGGYILLVDSIEMIPAEQRTNLIEISNNPWAGIYWDE